MTRHSTCFAEVDFLLLCWVEPNNLRASKCPQVKHLLPCLMTKSITVVHLPLRFRLGLLRACPLSGRITLTCAPCGREARCGSIALADCAAIASSCCCV